MSARRPVAIGVCLALACAAACAETIFRCGDSYSQTSCAGATVVEPAAPVGAAQRSDALAVAARERQLALEMARDRREREHALRPALAGSLGPARVAAPAPAPSKKHSRTQRRGATGDDTRDFVATVPKAKK